MLRGRLVCSRGANTANLHELLEVHDLAVQTVKAGGGYKSMCESVF